MMVGWRKGNKESETNITASTRDEVFFFLLEKHRSEVNRIFMNNSFQLHRRKETQEDAIHELCLVLAGWEPDTLVQLFNRPSFNNWLVGYSRKHLMTNGVFNRKYSVHRGRKAQSLELDDPFLDNEFIDKVMDPDIPSTLSIVQFHKLIKAILHSAEARELFKMKDVDFYILHFVEPLLGDCKLKTIKQVALDHNIPYATLLPKLREIKRWVKDYLGPFL